MEKENLILDDVADGLLILNKATIDALFRLDNCADCIALYVFYYKTVKWQKTNIIKATDAYIKKSLKWGADKIRKTKKTLKENGLIKVVQRREEGKIQGWYVEIAFVAEKKEEAPNSGTSHQNTQNLEHLKPTSGFQDTSAYNIYKYKCLYKNNINAYSKTPDWFDKDLEAKPMTEEAKKELEEILKEFGDDE